MGSSSTAKSTKLIGSCLAWIVATVTALSGCGLSTLQFSRDRRLSITGPPLGQRVTLPVTVRWRTGPGLSGTVFALFVDRTPMPPGQTLASLNSGDRQCAHNPTCTTPAYLAAQDVYLTTADQLVIEHVPYTKKATRHRVVLVLLDSRGERLGEAAWSTSFVARSSQ